MGTEAGGEVFALGEEVTRGGDDRGDESGKLRIVAARGWAEGDAAELARGQLRFGARDVHTVAFEEVAAEVLTVVGELQGGADGIGLGEEWGGGGCREIEPGELEDDASDGVGRACAIVEELVEGVIARDGLVLLEGIEEGVEEGGVEFEVMDRAGQISKVDFVRASWRCDGGVK